MKQATKIMLPVIVNGRGNTEAVVKELVSTLFVLLLLAATHVPFELD